MKSVTAESNSGKCRWKRVSYFNKGEYFVVKTWDASDCCLLISGLSDF